MYLLSFTPEGPSIQKKKGLPKFKKARKFTCTVCKAVCDTQAGLNAHHIKHHAPVICSTCNKQFLTPSTLARHRYSHSSLKFKCHDPAQGHATSSSDPW